MQTGNRARILGRLPLCVRKICWHRDDSLCHRRTEIGLCIAFELAQNHGRNFLRRILLSVNRNAPFRAHVAFDRGNGAVRIDRRLPFCRLTNQSLSILGKGNDRRRGAPALCFLPFVSRSLCKLSAAAVARNRNPALPLRHAKRRFALRASEKPVCFSLLKIQFSALKKSDKCHIFSVSLGKIARHHTKISINKHQNGYLIRNHMRNLIRNQAACKHRKDRRPNQRVGQRIKAVSACHKCHQPVLHTFHLKRTFSVLYLL